MREFYGLSVKSLSNHKNFGMYWYSYYSFYFEDNSLEMIMFLDNIVVRFSCWIDCESIAPTELNTK